MDMDYIIKTNDGEFVRAYSVSNFYGDIEEFCEHGFNGRRWKSHEVELVEYPTKHGRYRTYKYVNADIKIKKEEERKEREMKAVWEKSYSGKTDFNTFKEIYELGINARI
jgi:hypothetical protein